jgi:hypothetical protein
VGGKRARDTLPDNCIGTVMKITRRIHVSGDHALLFCGATGMDVHRHEKPNNSHALSTSTAKWIVL